MSPLSYYHQYLLDLPASSYLHWLRMMLRVHPVSTDGDLIGYSSVDFISHRPSLTPKTQQNVSKPRRMVDFLVFNSVY